MTVRVVGSTSAVTAPIFISTLPFGSKAKRCVTEPVQLSSEVESRYSDKSIRMLLVVVVGSWI